MFVGDFSSFLVYKHVITCQLFYKSWIMKENTKYVQKHYTYYLRLHQMSFSMQVCKYCRMDYKQIEYFSLNTLFSYLNFEFWKFCILYFVIIFTGLCKHWDVQSHLIFILKICKWVIFSISYSYQKINDRSFVQRAQSFTITGYNTRKWQCLMQHLQIFKIFKIQVEE